MRTISPAERLLGYFNEPQSQWLLRYVVIGFSVGCVAAAVSLGPFSGMGVPPMFGDFEAQRHWLEITQHLSPSKWYFYDLQWWGLDYPPLTAYHSWVLGKIGTWIDPSWFALDTSRGNETPGLKNYMRQTVLFSEGIFYVPAIVGYSIQDRALYNLPILQWAVSLAALLLQPSLLLIDNGHFQYNSVMLGLFVGSLVAFNKGKFVISAVLFTAALFFKQMALYYAPVIFAAMLGQTTSLRKFRITHFWRLVFIGLAVLVTAGIQLVPFASQEQLSQVVFRVFPFARGLWEDKVANLWCTLNTAIKLKEKFSAEQLPKMALAATVVAMLPSCIVAYARPTKRVLPWAFASCAWAFYLFSFQVHEKSVLLPLMPTSLLLFNPDPSTRAMVLWINNIAYYSLWPLLKRDGLVWQYFVVLLMWNYLFSVPLSMPKSILNQLVIAASYAAILLSSAAEYLSLLPPQLQRYQDIWVLANVTVSFGCFAYFWLWQSVQMIFYV